MDLLCFSIKHNNYAINILNVINVIDKFQLTYLPNKENKSIYLISYLNNIIPVYDINNNFNYRYKLILLLNNPPVFGIFIDEVKQIVRENIPIGYKLVSIEDIIRMITKDNSSSTIDIELFF